MERQKVQNPFSMGPAVNRPKYQPDLQSRVAPRASFNKGMSEGTYIADALVKFAGVAGDMYIAKTAKKVEADKIVQTSRAMQKMQPSSDATNAGYQAHAAVAIKGQMLKKQAELNALADTNITDEQWDEAAKSAYVDVDNFMMENYDNYAKSNELQKLTAVAMREAMPQATARREAAKIGFEIDGRMNAGTDVLVNGSKVLQGAVGTEALDLLNGMLKPLQLTASQKDQVLTNAILQTRDPSLIKLAKEFKGDRDTSLFSRTGSIQRIDDQLESQNLADSAIDIADERSLVEGGYLSGEMTKSEFKTRVKNRNSVLDNKFMSPSRYEYILDQYDKRTAENYRTGDLINAIQDPNVVETGATKKEEQAALTQMVKIREDSAQAKADAQGLEGDDREEFIKAEKVRTIAHVGDQSVKIGALNGEWVATLQNLATMNVPANLLEGKAGGFTVQDLPDKAQAGIQILDSLPPVARDEYISGIKNVDKGKTLRNFMHLRELGVDLPLALQRAQFLTAHPVPVDFTAIQTGVEEVRDKQEYFWWRKDIPDNQSDYMEQVLREKIMVDPNPASEGNINLVSNWMKNSWTTTKKGTRLLGDPGYIARTAKLNVTRLDNALDGYIDSQAERFLPMISDMGLDAKDVFPVTDPKTGTISLRTTLGPIPGTRRMISDLPKYAAQRKVKLEKAASDKYKDYMERQKGGTLYDKRYPTRRD